MADLPPDSGDDTDDGPDRRSTTGMPHWVKVFVIIAVALVLLLVIVQLTGIGGEHGPGRHMHASGAIEKGGQQT